MSKALLKNISKSFANKKVLVTGHTGFKGTWLCHILKELGSQIYGISLSPKSTDLYSHCDLSASIKSKYIDIRNFIPLNKSIKNFDPDFIFHLAAQPLVINSYKDPLKTFSTNFEGTLNLLESIRRLKNTKQRTVIIITTDKVYKDHNSKIGYSEVDELGGFDPYSSSKAACEILCDSYSKSFFTKNTNISIATARAGNVIGGGDFSESRIIPDIMRAFKLQKNLKIRMPDAIRPWQHVIEPLFGYLSLADYMKKNKLKSKKKNDETINFNFGPNIKDLLSLRDLTNLSIKFMNKPLKVNYVTPKYHETNYLLLSIKKAKKIIGWSPIWNSRKSIKVSIQWYKNFF